MQSKEDTYLLNIGKLALMTSSIPGGSMIFEMKNGRIIAEFRFNPITPKLQ